MTTISLTDIQAAINSNITKVDELNISNSQLQQANSAKQTTIDQQASEIARLKSDISTKDVAIVEQQNNIAELTNEIEKLEISIADKNSVIEQQASQIAALEEKLATGQQPVKEIFYSKEGLGLQAFINKAIANKVTAFLDQDITIDAQVKVSGDLILNGQGHRISTPIAVPFFLGAGKHTFFQLEINHSNSSPGSQTFKTQETANILWNNRFEKVNVSGCYNVYFSALGGSAGHVNETTLIDCNWSSRHVPFTNFSQDGKFKSVAMQGVKLYSEESHTMYIHPNVSLNFDDVEILHVGINNALAIHHFSGGGGEEGKGVTPGPDYVTLNNCRGVGNWQVEAPVNGRIEMSNCNIQLYEAPRTPMNAKDCTFNGGPFVGTAINCGGSYRPQDGSIIEHSTIDSIDLQEGGNITFRNCTISAMMCVKLIAGAKPLHITLINTTVIGAKFDKAIDLQVIKDEASGVGSLWGWTLPNTAIKPLEK